MAQYEISSGCPSCGSNRFKHVDDASTFTIVSVRECEECASRYVPPVPKWLAIVTIVVGSVCSVGGVVGGFFLYDAFEGGRNGGAIRWVCLLVAVAGIAFIVLGARNVRTPSDRDNHARGHGE